MGYIYISTIHQSISQSTCLVLLYLFTHLSIHPSIYPSIYLWRPRETHRETNRQRERFYRTGCYGGQQAHVCRAGRLATWGGDGPAGGLAGSARLCKTSGFVLERPSTSWMSPNHILESHLLYSIYWFKHQPCLKNTSTATSAIMFD